METSTLQHMAELVKSHLSLKAEHTALKQCYMDINTRLNAAGALMKSLPNSLALQKRQWGSLDPIADQVDKMYPLLVDTSVVVLGTGSLRFCLSETNMESGHHYIKVGTHKFKLEWEKFTDKEKLTPAVSPLKLGGGPVNSLSGPGGGVLGLVGNQGGGLVSGGLYGPTQQPSREPQFSGPTTQPAPFFPSRGPRIQPSVLTLGAQPPIASATTLSQPQSGYELKLYLVVDDTHPALPNTWSADIEFSIMPPIKLAAICHGISQSVKPGDQGPGNKSPLLLGTAKSYSQQKDICITFKNHTLCNACCTASLLLQTVSRSQGFSYVS